MSIPISSLGFPRIGPRRELKWSLERHWSGSADPSALLEAAQGLRAAAWARQSSLGVDVLPSSDFSLYDHVLDTSLMVGAIPDGYGWSGGQPSLETQFAMARGGVAAGGRDMPALEMTKWFDTNYHFVVPTVGPSQRFELAATDVIDAFVEARSLGFQTRPVILGPVSFLRLARSTDPAHDPLSLLPRLLPVYEEVLKRLAVEGARWVQVDEPTLVLDTPREVLQQLVRTYEQLAIAAPGLRLLLGTYFGTLAEALPAVLDLPVAGLHLDLVRAPEQLQVAVASAPAALTLSLGVVDGRDVWRTDLGTVLDRLEPAVERLGPERVILAPSCSLLHLPIDVQLETGLDPVTRGSLAFAVQRITELQALARAIDGGRAAIATELEEVRAALAARRQQPGVVVREVRERTAAVAAADLRRHAQAPERKVAQRAVLDLPAFPTTTIGSFPQTEELRRSRAAVRSGTLDEAGYRSVLRAEVEHVVRWQEAAGLDVLVHGEPERNDMVQYFAEQLEGYVVTEHGWVQSYGSRCVRPPVIAGDVSRVTPITVEWAVYAQSLTARPVKGMLTGPVTMLQWSFCRDDLPRPEVARQIALALRDEVADLEAAGIRIIQVDEPAFREGAPLRAVDQDGYYAWAAEAFRLATGGVADATQVHSHMCYADFNDILPAIASLDADVISLEASRSDMELLAGFATHGYAADVGPGVFDVHSPRAPGSDAMAELLRAAVEQLSSEQLWVNPDCGLKTRRWEEVELQLDHMVEAARRLRDEHIRAG